ncbi:MAG: hypothetical protein QOF43_1538 [Gaiellaceae bacterium]|jgi:Fic family protein|nr:hypothetical protein [Gaiellaceae bacterium]
MSETVEQTRRGRPSRTSVLETLDRALADLAGVGGLPLPTEAEEIWKGIWFEETHGSTAIEGNTLVLKQVEILLEEGRAVGDKELSDYLEVQGYADAANWVYAQATHESDWTGKGLISKAELREIHRRVVEPVWQLFPPDNLDPGEGPGSFRKKDIRPFAGGMQPPPHPDVAPRIDDWLKEANKGPADGHHPMFFLAERHAAFEQIHPFRDGNGRAGRLVLNLLLVRHGYPPAIIHKRDRKRYLTALDKADNGDAGPLAEMLARTVRTSIDRFLLPALAGPHRLVPITALPDELLSHNALLVAVKRGRLRAIQKDGHWYSTKQWVGDYKASRYQRKPAAS